ncbi:uncharacterized protein MKK02DRAFT_39961 [Dioszegia hungarica]|uniref:C2H2-type domain-containing protein n=1 Tax=Dioszegia hungarica TaxID=4972 RepID=A0AA38HDH0_9TREE|nr:uncharacterized protein MKK02DRAFT_39961 [Dioszegia hungarica]KAI9639638.1 hypothetical protein MKK02DRAFT_39961 [Dioszegia hungarica]
MPPPTQPQPVTRANGRSPLSDQPVAGPSSVRMGGSPMTGLSYGGRSMRVSSGGMGGGGAGSYGARFYGGGFDSPSNIFSSSITMESSSFNTSSAAFNLGTSASFRGGRSYAAAAKGERDHLLHRPQPPNHGSMNPAALSSSFAGMSFQPMSFSFGAGSYNKSQVHSLMANASASSNRVRTDAELTRTYECCGNTHHGLHDLLEHVEDAHPFTDPDSSGVSAPHVGYSPQVMAMEMDMDVAEAPNLGTIEERASGQGSTRSSMSPTAAPGMPSYPVPTSASSSKPSTPNEGAPSPAALQISDVLTSPWANSPLSLGGPPKPKSQPPSAGSNASTSSSPPEGSLATPTTSTQQSPVFTVPKVGPTRGFLGAVPRLPQQRFDRAFNEVVAGSPKNMENQLSGPKTPKSTLPTAVAPGVLFASAAANLGIPTGPPVPGGKAAEPAVAANGAAAIAGAADSGVAAPAPKPSTEIQLPEPSPFTTHKPWKCPNIGCNKSYKQSNGLKYHLSKGQCDFALSDAIETGMTIEEAEDKARPWVCAVNPATCQKRYRQANGLKYHYLNSGEHGLFGLRMLQNGTHPIPSGSSSSNVPKPNSVSTATSSVNTSSSATANPAALRRPLPGPTPTSTATATASAAAASSAARPYHIPSQIGATRPRMGVFPPNTTPARAGMPGGLAGIGRAGVPVRPSIHSAGGMGNGLMQGQKPAPPPQLPPQRGRDAVLFAAVETMDL